jgi:predicted Zn-dependent peptidase
VYPRAAVEDAHAAANQLVYAPQTGRLKSGLRYILQPGGATPITSIDLWFRSPSMGFATLPMPAIAHFSAETIAASAVVGGDTLSRFVQNLVAVSLSKSHQTQLR